MPIYKFAILNYYISFAKIKIKYDNKKMTENNKKFSTIFAIMLSLTALKGSALEIIYPKQNPAVINAKSTFFIGNTKPNSNLTINNKNVKVWDDGSFVQVVPLVDGDNIFTLKSEINSEKEEIVFILKKAPQISQTIPTTDYQAVNQGEYIYSNVIKDDTPLRSAPDENAQRLTHLSSGTVLLLEGKKGSYYKVNLGDNSNAWVSEKNVAACSNINERILASICETKFDEDKYFNYLKMNLSLQVPYKVVENGNNLQITIYGTKQNQDFINKLSTQKVFESLQIKQTTNDNITLEIPSDYKLWGYDCYYEENNLVFKKRKFPTIKASRPLDNQIIAIDAGHGGNESGAIGPTGEKEKNINLDVAKKLEIELKKAGAHVVMIRNDDSNVDLFERVKIAKKNNALISVSIHANALPDGGDPFVKHGTATFYYNQESKDLAELLKSQLIQDLGTNDDGSSKASFVLTRATTPLSILIEVAYIIHPKEYQLLLNDEFRQKAAISIKNGIEKYLLTNGCLKNQY